MSTNDGAVPSSPPTGRRFSSLSGLPLPEPPVKAPQLPWLARCAFAVLQLTCGLYVLHQFSNPSAGSGSYYSGSGLSQGVGNGVGSRNSSKGR
jgi:hypothetical protein